MPSNNGCAVFTSEMKDTHTLLIPMMIEPHFSIISEALRLDGYKTELLTNTSPTIAGTALRYLHNDICYPAVLVIGQFIEALQSGRYDLKKTALLITQTGGGCRASNYLCLLRKALRQSGFADVPAVSCNVGKMDENSLSMSPSLLLNCLFAIMYGDFLLNIFNQSRSHEVVKGSSRSALERCLAYLYGELRRNRFTAYKKHLRHMLGEFDNVEQDGTARPRVAIVGEIYLKYSPLGNNGLEDFLIGQGAEPVVSGLMNFALYCMDNMLTDKILYNIGGRYSGVIAWAIKLVTKKQRQAAQIIEEHGRFDPPYTFAEIDRCSDGIVSRGVKMGEGWLLGSEIAADIEHGVTNVVCAQPFGCLPNHIASKGVMSRIRAKYPQANVVTVDYDSGACRINQENRLKLMLMNANAGRAPAARPAEDVAAAAVIPAHGEVVYT